MQISAWAVTRTIYIIQMKTIALFWNYIFNKNTPEGVYAGGVDVRKNYWYVEWEWKVE